MTTELQRLTSRKRRRQELLQVLNGMDDAIRDLTAKNFVFDRAGKIKALAQLADGVSAIRGEFITQSHTDQRDLDALGFNPNAPHR